MKPDDILDAIGNIDDVCVKKAKEKKIAPLFRFGGRDAFTFARQ